MRFLVLLIFVLVIYGVSSYFIKLYQLRQIQKMFRRYNDSQNIDVIVDWIRMRGASSRMVRTLDYLQKIEQEDLAVKVYTAFPTDQFRQRHTRLFAAGAFAKIGDRQSANELIERLRSDFPNDDSILERYVEIAIGFEEWPKVREALEPRMGRKFKGTIFLRQWAQLLAAEGDQAKAIEILQDVVKREHILYVNTFAQPQKRQIYEQYAASQKILDALTGETAETS